PIVRPRFLVCGLARLRKCGWATILPRTRVGCRGRSRLSPFGNPETVRDRGTRGPGDQGTRRQGDKRTRRTQARKQAIKLPPSPCPLVPRSPCPFLSQPQEERSPCRLLHRPLQEVSLLNSVSGSLTVPLC